jgi:hypothetical protein
MGERIDPMKFLRDASLYLICATCLLTPFSMASEALPSNREISRETPGLSPALYPEADKLISSPGHTTYYVDPHKGKDTHSGTTAQTAWKSIAKVNGLQLAPGDKVLIAAGHHEATLKPSGAGTVKEPIIIEFLPGVHEFGVDTAYRIPLYVSNSCDAPTVPKPIAILIQYCAHFRLQGGGLEGNQKTLLLMGGRMVEMANLHSVDIEFKKLVIDLKRPTVSEFRVMEVAGDTATLQIAEGSSYEIKEGRFCWTGDLGQGNVMVQQVNLEEGRCWRRGFGWDSFVKSSAQELKPRMIQLTCEPGSKAYGMTPGHQYQFRSILRDSVGIHNARSKDIRFVDCVIHALTGMGVVSQFTENLTFRRVHVVPPQGTIRTCPAWGDIFQFSNCRGDIIIEDCVESGMQDDAVNCHGTHLRIVAKPSENQCQLRYMQPQTYGFSPFVAGDELAVVDHQKLRELPNNPRRKVVACVRSDQEGKEWIVTLDGPAPAYAPNDVVDNITWHPNLTIRRSSVALSPVRGYLITTRGRVIIEDCVFHRCSMPGILIEDDAKGWFESTCIRDMVIRHCRFIGCDIEINPQTVSNDPKEPVHENIRIQNNFFDGGSISAKGVKGLILSGNKTSTGAKVATHVSASCSDIIKDD